MTDWEVWHPTQQTAEDSAPAPTDEVGTDAEMPTGAANEYAGTEPNKPKHAPSRNTQTDDLSDLTLAIEIYPDVAVNYLLRGELYAKRLEWVLAEEDFKKALQLASEQLEQSSWGVAEQMVMDSARRALEQLKSNW
jgi:hypothetical protein